MSISRAAAGGQLRFELQDADGKTLPGFALSDCEPLTGDAIDSVVKWPGALAKLQHVPVRIRVEMTNADLYAIQF